MANLHIYARTPTQEDKNLEQACIDCLGDFGKGLPKRRLQGDNDERTAAAVGQGLQRDS